MGLDGIFFCYTAQKSFVDLFNLEWKTICQPQQPVHFYVNVYMIPKSGVVLVLRLQSTVVSNNTTNSSYLESQHFDKTMGQGIGIPISLADSWHP